MKISFFTDVMALIVVLTASSAVFAQASWPCGATANDKVTATLNAEGVLTIRGIGNMMDRMSEQAEKESKEKSHQDWMRRCDADFKECMRYAITQGKAQSCRGRKMECEALFVATGGKIAELSAEARSAFSDLVSDLVAASSGKETTKAKNLSMPYDEYLDAITKVVIENGVTSVGGGAFIGMDKLTTVTIGNSVKVIGYRAFGLCGGLKSVTIPNSATSIESETFIGCSSLTSITIPNSVKYIGNGTFGACVSLRSITIPNSVTSIGQYAFESCTGLTSITIPNSVTSIGQWMFQGCTGLTSITIPNSVTSIGGFAFARCTNLTSITIGQSVATIGNGVFDSSGIAFITMLNPTPPQIDAATFDGIDKENCILFVPEGSIYKLANQWKGFMNIRFGMATEEVFRAEQQRKEEHQQKVEMVRKRMREAELQRWQKETQQKIDARGSLTDSRDGKTYKTVKIGGKTWMAENLNYKKGKSWCYDGANSICDRYGRLYNWKTAKSICPAGWHLPSRQEWEVLVTTAGGQKVAGKKLKAIAGWSRNGNGTDEYEFSAMPGGYIYNGGGFSGVGQQIGTIGHWWTATEIDGSYAYSRQMGHYEGVIDWMYKNYDKGNGFSVRCVKDD